MRNLTLSHTTPDGKRFTYSVTGITRKCWVIEADHTGAIRQYRSRQALRRFILHLWDHLDAKYPAVITAGTALALAA